MGSEVNRRITNKFWSKRSVRWSCWLLGLLVFVGVFADFLANEKPIYCVYNGKSYWPIFQAYMVDLGVSSWDEEVLYLDWHEADFESAILPLIPYSATYLDGDNAGFKKPFGPQNIASARYRHWLGTDQIGRDIAAGLVNGTRISLAVGLLSMLIATLIGLTLGMLGGYYGDKDYKLSMSELLAMVLIGCYLIFLLASDFSFRETILFFILFSALTIGVSKIISLANFSIFKRLRSIPIDLLVMRIIEVINSFPALFTILAIVAIIKRPSLFSLVLIIGLIRWTGIARFARAEMLKVRSSGYIKAVKGLGLSDARILWKHALPNVLPPILITIAFGIAGAILLESFLSFLGIGVDPTQVTWGTLLQIARQNFSNWWLALLPGIAIFITVTVFNLIGEGLAEALEP